MGVFDQVANGLGTLNRAINSPAPLNGFSINEFKSNVLKNGVLRKNLYLVQLFAPGYPQGLMYYTESVNIPAVDLATVNIRRYGYGPVESVPYMPQFQNLSMTIIAEAGQENILTTGLRKISEVVAFQNYTSMSASTGGASQVYSTPYEVGYKKDFEFDIKVFVYNEQQDAILIYVFKQCYARQIGSVNLGWGNNDSYLSVDVNFAFTDFSLESTTNPISDALNSLAGLTSAFGLGSTSSVFNALKYPVGIAGAINIFNGVSVATEVPNTGSTWQNPDIPRGTERF